MHSTPDRFPRSILRHPLILPLYLPALLLSVAQGLILPVLPLYAREFNAPYLWVGLVLAGDGLGLLAGDIPAGLVMQRLDRRGGMLLGISLVGLGTLACFWAGSLPEALLYRFIAGLGNALYNVARHTYVADTITIANRGKSVALLGGTFRMGRMLGPVIGGMVAGSAGIRWPFVLYALVCAAAAFAIFYFNRGNSAGQGGLAPRAAADKHAKMTPRSLARSLRGHARVLAAPGVGHYLMQMVRAGPAVVLPLYGATVLGMQVEEIGYLMGVASFIDMLFFYPTGIIMDRFGRKWAVVPSALIMSLGLALIPFTGSPLGLAAAAVLNGLGNGLGSGVMITMGADLAPREGRSEFLGLWSLIGDAGSSSGPVLVGAVTDLLALSPATWVIATSGLAAASVFGLLVPETLKRSAEPA